MQSPTDFPLYEIEVTSKLGTEGLLGFIRNQAPLLERDIEDKEDKYTLEKIYYRL